MVARAGEAFAAPAGAGPMRAIRWLALGAILLLAGPSSAHIVNEAPWHAIPYAYRSVTFLLDLEPVDWALVEQKLVTDDGGEVVGAPALERLRGIDAEMGTAHAAAIERALDGQDEEALFAAATRATAQAVRHHLARAANALDRPGVAQQAVAEARDIFRAFAEPIRETDPDAFRELGLAWLDLASSIGHAGIGDSAAQPSDPEAFARARSVIEDYLRANYEPERFAARADFAPIPEQPLRADPSLELSPTLPPGSDINDQDPLPRLVLNFEERGVDERDLFLVAFGDMLFDSPEIFGEPARSLGIACSTCHNRSDINQRFFIAGVTPQPGAVDVDAEFFNPRFNDHRADALDIPSLRGLRYTAPYGRDGRFASLRDFTRNVIVNEFAGEEPSPLMLDALVTYILEFDFLPAPYLNRDGTLNEKASEAAKRGEAIFNRPFAQMHGRSCASCHVPDSHFTDGMAHDIGSGGQGYTNSLDGAYDTPTLLGSVHTAPYFHDGSLETLGEVVDWFDRRFELDLGEQERADLVAYLEAVGTGEAPYETFDERNTPFRLMMDELSVFLSTLDTLIPARDKEHADLLLRTVAADMEADASAMTNRAARTKAYELADLLWELRDTIDEERWDDAAALWAAYQARAETYDPEMF